MNNIDRELEKRSEVLSNGAKQAIVLCAESFRFGGNWGFIRKDNHQFEGIVNTLREESANVKLRVLSNGALILCNRDFLSSAVNQVVPNAINAGFVEKAKTRSEQEKQKYVKFLDSVVSGKSKYAKQFTGFSELILGIYSVNDTNLIRLNGIDYPAYKLELTEALSFARYLSNKGKTVYVKVMRGGVNQVAWVTLEELLYNKVDLKDVYKALEIADSHTGVFLTLRLKG